MATKAISKKIVMIAMILFMIAGIFFAISNFTSAELEGEAVWKKAHYVTPDFIPCFDAGQDCCVVTVEIETK